MKTFLRSFVLPFSILIGVFGAFFIFLCYYQHRPIDLTFSKPEFVQFALWYTKSAVFAAGVVGLLSLGRALFSGTRRR